MEVEWLDKNGNSQQATIPGGMTLWLDASDDATVDTTGQNKFVRSWTSKGSSAIVFNPSKGNNRPGRETIAPSGLPVITFNRNSNKNKTHFLTADNVAYSNVFGNVDNTLFVVIQQDSKDNKQYWFRWERNGDNEPYLYLYSDADSKLGFNYDNREQTWDGASIRSALRIVVATSVGSETIKKPSEGPKSSGYLTKTVKFEMSVSDKDDVSDLRLWAADKTETYDYYGNNALSGKMILGALDDEGNDSFDGDIAEIIVYNSALSAGQITEVQTYLQKKWFGVTRDLEPVTPECPAGTGLARGLSVKRYETNGEEVPADLAFANAITAYASSANLINTNSIPSGEAAMIDGGGSYINGPDGFISLFRGFFFVENPGNYSFRTVANDSSEFKLRDKELTACAISGIFSNDDCSDTSEILSLDAGYYPIEFNHTNTSFFRLGRYSHELYWQPPGQAGYELVPSQNLAYCKPGETTNNTIRVSAQSDALTCRPHSVTLSVLDANGDPDNDYSGNVSLNTGKSVSWSVASGNGSLSGSGSVWQYQFNSEGSVTLNLSYQQAGTLTVAAALDAGDSDSVDITFRPSGLVASASSPQIAGKPFSISLRAVTEAENAAGNLICETISGYNQSGIEGWYRPVVPGSLATGSSLTAGDDAFGKSELNAQPIAVVFRDGAATLSNLKYNDAGKIAIAFKDDSVGLPGDGGDELVGGLQLLFNPLALIMTDIDSDGKNDSGGFAEAGQPFSFKIKAVASDSNDSNLSDNPVTPSFAGAITLTPQNVDDFAVGSLSAATVSADKFVSGVATLDGFTRYSEVGPLKIGMLADDYLEAENQVTGTSDEFGWFYPARYAVTGTPEVSNGNSTNSGCADFTYMHDPAIGVSVTVQAQSRTGELTTNYGSKLLTKYGADFPFSSVPIVAEAAADPDMSSRLCERSAGSCLNDFSGSWQGGEWLYSTTQMLVSKRATPDGPLAVQFGVRVDDPNGGAISAADMLDSSAKSIGAPLPLRYGRLRGENAYGAETVGLALPLEVQYYKADESRFVRAADDACSKLVANHLSFSNQIAGKLGDIPLLNGDGATTDVNYSALAKDGNWAAELSAPNHDGRVPLQFELGEELNDASLYFLKHDWDGDGDMDNPPELEAVWGRYRGNDRVIYWREEH